MKKHKKINIVLIIFPLLIMIYVLLISCSRYELFDFNKSENSDKKNINPSLNDITFEYSNDFACNLYKKIRNNYREENIFISPFGVHLVLSMIYNGTRGETKAQFEKVLSFNTPNSINTFYKEYFSNYSNDAKPGNYLDMDNAFWLQKNFTLNADYEEKMLDYYNVELNTVDFLNDIDNSRASINKWVYKASNKRFDEALEPEMLDNVNTKLVLMNVTTFRGEWLKPFHESATKEDVFYDSQNNKDTVPFMKQTDRFNYFENNVLKMIELLYEETAFSFYVMLPKKKYTVDDISQQFSSKKFMEYRKQMGTKQIVFSLPKFELAKSYATLNDELTNMGLGGLFKESANLLGINPNPGLKVSRVFQKTYFVLNEKYTEAGAVSGAITVVTARESKEKPLLFTVNQPFIFIIYDKAHNVILFIGEINNLKKE